MQYWIKMTDNLARVNGDNYVIIKNGQTGALSYASAIKPHVRNALCLGVWAAQYLHSVSDLLPGL